MTDVTDFQFPNALLPIVFPLTVASQLFSGGAFASQTSGGEDVKTQDILQAKGSRVHKISPRATLDQVVQTLVAHNCGSLLVMDGPRLLGIVTERDILRTVASDLRELKDINVTEKMSKTVVTSSPQDDLGDVMSVLTENRIRHLPVISEGELAGIISIGDVVKAQQKSLAKENAFLRSYIHG